MNGLSRPWSGRWRVASFNKGKPEWATSLLKPACGRLSIHLMSTRGRCVNNPVIAEILVILKLTHLRQLQLNSNAIWQELNRLTSKLIWKNDQELSLYGERPSSYSADKMPQQVRWLENLMNLSLTHVGTSSITLSSLPPTRTVTYALPNKWISLI